MFYCFGVSGRPKLSANIVDVWDEALNELAMTEEDGDGMLKVGLLPSYKSAKDIAAHVEKEAAETKVLFAR